MDHRTCSLSLRGRNLQNAFECDGICSDAGLQKQALGRNHQLHIQQPLHCSAWSGLDSSIVDIEWSRQRRAVVILQPRVTGKGRGITLILAFYACANRVPPVWPVVRNHGVKYDFSGAIFYACANEASCHEHEQKIKYA